MAAKTKAGKPKEKIKWAHQLAGKEMAAGNIDLWVSGGSFNAPYYQFYTNAAGTEELTELSLDTDYTYTFRRLGGATSHPFYISDTGFKEASTDAITINGNGSHQPELQAIKHSPFPLTKAPVILSTCCITAQATPRCRAIFN